MIKVHIKRSKTIPFVQAARMLGFTVSVTQETSPGWYDVEIKEFDNMEQVALIALASKTPRSALMTTNLRPFVVYAR